MERDRFMTPEEAKAFGLVDEVIAERPAADDPSRRNPVLNPLLAIPGLGLIRPGIGRSGDRRPRTSVIYWSGATVRQPSAAHGGIKPLCGRFLQG